MAKITIVKKKKKKECDPQVLKNFMDQNSTG